MARFATPPSPRTPRASAARPSSSVRSGKLRLCFSRNLRWDFGGVQGDAVDFYAGLLVIGHPVSEGAGFFSAAGGVVFGVEVEDGLLAG